MAMNEPFDWRQSDRRLFAAVAILFPVIMLIGFGRSYYVKFAFGNPPLPSVLVHFHGLLMTLWIAFFILQVWLIRSMNHKVHMKTGFFGVALAAAIVVVGFFTAVAGAKYPSPSFPPAIPPLAFLAVPLFDIALFAILFGAAIIYRKRPAEHKRLMILTVLSFLPPGLARFPFEPFVSGGPLVFFGVPAALAIGLLIYDTWRMHKLNRVFLAGSLLLIASYPIRLALSGTDLWMSFASWLTAWAA